MGQRPSFTITTTTVRPVTRPTQTHTPNYQLFFGESVFDLMPVKKCRHWKLRLSQWLSLCVWCSWSWSLSLWLSIWTHAHTNTRLVETTTKSANTYYVRKRTSYAREPHVSPLQQRLRLRNHQFDIDRLRVCVSECMYVTIITRQ